MGKTKKIEVTKEHIKNSDLFDMTVNHPKLKFRACVLSPQG